MMLASSSVLLYSQLPATAAASLLVQLAINTLRDDQRSARAHLVMTTASWQIAPMVSTCSLQELHSRSFRSIDFSLFRGDPMLMTGSFVAPLQCSSSISKWLLPDLFRMKIVDHMKILASLSLRQRLNQCSGATARHTYLIVVRSELTAATR